MSAREVADLYQISPAQVSRMYAAFIEDKELETQREDWTVPKDAIKSLENFKSLEIDILKRKQEKSMRPLISKING